MKEQQKLTISMAIFFLIVFVSYGVIVLNEKKEELFLPKIEEKLTNYLEENYKDLLSTTTTSIEYKNNQYTMTITNTSNENLYFTINYKDKEITDTYQEDYLEGNSYLTYLEKQIEKEITNKTSKEYNITILTTLDSMTSKIKEKVLQEQNITSLKIYNLQTEIPITNWSTESITSEVSTLITSLTNQNITPKNYTFIITNKNNIYQSIKISNLTTNLIENNTLNLVIDDIINNRNSSLLNENNITYEYLN